MEWFLKNWASNVKILYMIKPKYCLKIQCIDTFHRLSVLSSSSICFSFLSCHEFVHRGLNLDMVGTIN